MMLLRNSIFLFVSVCFLSTPFAYGVPGLERVLKRLHPNLEVSCTTCHDRKNGEKPDNQNVSREGRLLYGEVLLAKPLDTPRPGSLLRPTRRPDFIVWGDSRTNIDIQKRVVQKIIGENPVKVFHTGDMVASGGEPSQWENMMIPFDTFIKQRNFYPACGNHEGEHCTNNVFRKALENQKRYYTVDVGKLTFVALDSHNVTGEELQWLAALPLKKNYVPFFHHPAYPTLAGHGPEPIVLKEFVPRLKRLGIKLAFTGHNHGYDRGIVDGTQWVSTGGGGAPLYPCGENKPYTKVCVSDYHYVKCWIQEEEIECVATLLSGAQIDSFTVDYKHSLQ